MKNKRISSRSAAIPVPSIDFVMYNTKNIRRAREFYQKLFGLKRGAEYEQFVHARMALFNQSALRTEETTVECRYRILRSRIVPG